MTDEAPAAGRRVRVTAPGYPATVYHALYLPTDWLSDKRYPIIVEFPGNRYRDARGDECTGTPEGAKLGYGASGGKGFIWVCLPFLNGGGTAIATQWWGDSPSHDVTSTVAYCKKVVRQICRDLGGDEGRVILAGFSRGAIACNRIGLHDDDIAHLWRGFIVYSHYDGVRRWGLPGDDRESAAARLRRLGERPQFICHEGDTGTNGPLAATRRYLESTGIRAPFTFASTGFVNHSDGWVLRPTPARDTLRRWVARVLETSASPTDRP